MAIYDQRHECMNREELLQLQLERLQATVNRCYKNVPFYRRRLDDLGIEPEGLQSLDDLRALPFTTKEDLRASYPYDLVAVPLREVVRFHLSSGTTGAPTVIAYTANDLQHWTNLVARNLAAGEITREDVVQIFFGYGLFPGGKLTFWILAAAIETPPLFRTFLNDLSVNFHFAVVVIFGLGSQFFIFQTGGNGHYFENRTWFIG